MTTWNIYKADGHYVGQAHATSAETAFREYMALVAGVPRIPLDDIKANELKPAICEIIYNKEVFTVQAVTY